MFSGIFKLSRLQLGGRQRSNQPYDYMGAWNAEF